MLPAACEVPSIASVKQEIFGPVLHIVRFCAEQTVTVNTTAAGGNVALLA